MQAAHEQPAYPHHKVTGVLSLNGRGLKLVLSEAEGVRVKG
jgi:hypothetical protein